MKSMLRLAIGILNLIAITPSFAGMILLSETRSVTASYYGGGTETITSDGTFGAFEATAHGTPFGGGFVTASQKSDITADGFTIQHRASDYYGPGGSALSSFAVSFLLQEATRIIIDGYCNFYSGSASLTSGGQIIPLSWGGPPGDYFRNYLAFDQVLGPGVYSFTTTETARETVTTRISLRAVPDEGATAWMLIVGTALCAVSCRGALRRRSI